MHLSQNLRRGALACCLLAAALGPLHAATSKALRTTTATAAVTSEVYAAATTFYDSLGSSQKAKVQLAWSLDTARHWSNLPAALVSRNGVAMNSLNDAQRALAEKLFKAALGKKGKRLQNGMMSADDYLADQGGGSSYGTDNYYIAFLGSPSASSFWLLQITGHHLTFNLALNGNYLSPTPLFLGIEPKGEFTQDSKTLDPMQAQREAVAALGSALTAYSGAKLSGSYPDLLFGANGSGGIDGSCPRNYASVTSHGLAYDSLASDAQELVRQVIRAYVNTQASETADLLLDAYLDKTALAETYVAYAGSGTVTTRGNYFRIEGPRMWIEFSVQNGVIISGDIHFHSIWRDKVADYGGSCL